MRTGPESSAPSRIILVINSAYLFECLDEYSILLPIARQVVELR